MGLGFRVETEVYRGLYWVPSMRVIKGGYQDLRGHISQTSSTWDDPGISSYSFGTCLEPAGRMIACGFATLYSSP